MVVSHLLWVLGTKLQSGPRLVGAQTLSHSSSPFPGGFNPKPLIPIFQMLILRSKDIPSSLPKRLYLQIIAKVEMSNPLLTPNRIALFLHNVPVSTVKFLKLDPTHLAQPDGITTPEDMSSNGTLW